MRKFLWLLLAFPLVAHAQTYNFSAANSEILITEDTSLGTKLGVTCSTFAGVFLVSARTVGTSFSVLLSAAPTGTPACFSYVVLN